jgi:tRNA pseudouridine38-40 synthase
MTRIALGLAYDGAPWLGWQTQRGGRTVQDTLEAVLASFLARPTSTICAGRTDTGVHALEQVVHIDTPVVRREESWVRGVNAMLPPSIRVQWATEVDSTFHARFSATARTYIYLLRVHRVASPILHGKTGWYHRPLDLAAMQGAAQLLVGEHDFSAFRSSECQAASPVRTLHQLDVAQLGDFFIFTFKANAFLHHMVRNLMGALMDVGKGNHAPEWMPELLRQRDRRLAPATFQAAGLYLARADYPESFALPSQDPLTSLASHLGISLS